MKKTDLIIIGNGFDLYHDLPTRFIDFYNFVNKFDLIYNLKEEKIEELKTKENSYEKDEEKEKQYKMLKKCYFHYKKHGLKNEILEKIKQYINKTNGKFDNNLLEYWKEIREYNIIENNIHWSDFEMLLDELLKIIHEYYEKDINQQNENSIKLVKDIFNKKTTEIIEDNVLKDKKYRFYNNKKNLIKSIFIYKKNQALRMLQHPKEKDVIEEIFEDFKKFKNLFIFYISYFINNFEIDEFSQDFIDITKNNSFDVLTFNFSDINRFYEKKDYKPYKWYVHGKAEYDNFINLSNNYNNKDIVIGIPDNSFDDIGHIEFQKFFQRIMYKNECIGEEKIAEYFNIYIFGHSLHFIDESILKMIFSKKVVEHKKIIIYYKNDNDKKKKMINILKWYGKEEFIKDTASNRIIFKELKEPIKIPREN